MSALAGSRLGCTIATRNPHEIFPASKNSLLVLVIFGPESTSFATKSAQFGAQNGQKVDAHFGSFLTKLLWRGTKSAHFLRALSNTN